MNTSKRSIIVIIYLMMTISFRGAFAGTGTGANDDISNMGNNTSAKVGLALSGGGARGIAHIGVIIALEENNIPIDLIAGTSMGSIVGGLYAAGYSGSEMQRLVNEIDWVGLFNQSPDPALVLVSKRYGMMEPIVRLRFKMWDIYLPYGMNNGQRISETLFHLTAPANFAARTDFDSLVVPFRATAVDVASAELLFLKRGDLAQAIHASMAIPMLFSPARVDDRMLVDGGVLNILPTDVTKEMGADIIIACDLEGLFPLGQEPKHFADVAIHTLDITIRELKKGNVKLADILIEPDLGDHSSSDYSGLDSLIRLGYEATMSQMDNIKSLVPESLRRRKEPKRQLDQELINRARIDYIKVKGNDRVRLPVITGEFAMNEGDVFNLDMALHGVKKIYATGLFENVWLEPEYLADDLVGVNIHVIEKYPRTIGFGLNYRSEEGTGGFVQIVHFNFFGWGERFMPLLRVGDLYKRAGLEIVNDRFFATPLTVHNGIYYERESPYIYDADGNKTGNLEMDRVVAQFSVGVQPNSKLMFTTGLRGERVWLGRNQYLDLNSQTLENWNAFGQILFDNTDDRYFPNHGVRLVLNGESIVEFKPAAKPYTKIFGELNWHFPVGRATISLNIFAGASTDGLPIYEQFRFGGPFRVPGYHRNELWSNEAQRAALGVRFKFFKIWHFIVGASSTSMDGGKSFINGLTAGVVAATPVGPIRLVYGRADDNREQVYFSLGYDF